MKHTMQRLRARLSDPSAIQAIREGDYRIEAP